MIRIMLTDFNPDVTSFYKSFLKATFPSVRIAATLHESSEDKFFDTVKSKKPDLIIMDIWFFGMSGLRIISDMRIKHPNIKMLIIGGLDDHDYLRAAMERGAGDYLYKPLKNRELEMCLERMMRIFAEMESKRQENAQILREYEQSTALFRDRFLINLLEGVLINPDEIQESMEYFGMSLDAPYTVFTLRIDHFKTVIAHYTEKEKHMLIYRVYYAAQQYLDANKLGYTFINSFNSISCIIGGHADVGELLAICEEIKVNVEEKTEMSVTIGLGRAVVQLSDVNISAKEADAALRYRYLMGYNTVIPIEFVEPGNYISYSYPTRKEDLLVYTAVAGEFEYAKNLLEQILQTLDSPSGLPQRLLPKIVMNIVISISRYASEQQMDVEARFREFFDLGVILSISTIDEARSYMQQGLQSFCAHVVSLRKAKADSMVSLVINHINNNYYEDLSVEKFALDLRTTPQYLDKNFRDALKVSVSGHITNVRIAKAKEILRAENVEDDVVAARVGYRDVRVFRSVFRRREGMMPAEYSRVRH